MELKEFATQHRLTIKKDSCGDEVIPGRPRNIPRTEDRCHIYVHSTDGSRFGLALMLTSVGKWHNRTKEALAAGFTMWQNGTDEGNLLFDPKDKSQAKLAIKMAGCRGKAVLSPERLANLQARGQRLAALKKPTVETALEA
jgi:hypothetical protein